MILSTIILDTDLYVSLSCLSCFKTKPLGVLSQQFIRKHYRDQQIYHPSKLWNKRSFQVILSLSVFSSCKSVTLKKNPVVLMTHPHDSVAIRSVCILNWGGSYRGKTFLYAPFLSSSLFIYFASLYHLVLFGYAFQKFRSTESVFQRFIQHKPFL